MGDAREPQGDEHRPAPLIGECRAQRKQQKRAGHEVGQDTGGRCPPAPPSVQP